MRVTGKTAIDDAHGNRTQRTRCDAPGRLGSEIVRLQFICPDQLCTFPGGGDIAVCRVLSLIFFRGVRLVRQGEVGFPHALLALRKTHKKVEVVPRGNSGLEISSNGVGAHLVSLESKAVLVVDGGLDRRFRIQ